MKRMLLIAGVILVVLCVLLLLYATINMHAYYNLLDGSAGHYKRLHDRMILSFVTGALIGVVGAVCFIIRSKM